MRERLIELFKKIEKEPAITCPAYKTDKTCKGCKYSINDSLCNHIERQVDYLLENDVIVPPCKVGDTVYYIPSGNHIIECIVAQIVIEPFAEIGMSFLCYGGVCFDMRDWGKTIFLTREEAERALKGGD